MNKTLQINGEIRPRQWVFVVGAFALMTLAVIVHYLMVSGNAAYLDIRSTLSAELWYQVFLAGLALGYLVLVRAVHPINFHLFDSFGNGSAHPAPVAALGITGDQRWRVVGRVGMVVFALIGAFYAYVTLWHRTIPPLDQILPAIGLGALLAGGSAFAITAITRFGLVVTLHGIVPPRVIYVLAAMMCAIPQFFLFPGGLMRAIIAAVMGWIAAKSVVETRGTVYAWGMQFVYDWVIYAALLTVMVM